MALWPLILYICFCSIETRGVDRYHIAGGPTKVLMASGHSEGLPSQTVLGTPQSHVLLADLLYIWPYEQGSPQVALLLSDGHTLLVAVTSAAVYRELALHLDENVQQPRLVRYRHQGTFTVDTSRLNSDFAVFTCDVNGGPFFWSVAWIDLLGPGSLGSPKRPTRSLPHCYPFVHSNGISCSTPFPSSHLGCGSGNRECSMRCQWLSVFQSVNLGGPLTLPASGKRRNHWFSDDVFGDIAAQPAVKKTCPQPFNDPDYSVVMDTPEAIASSSSSRGDDMCVHQ